MSDLVEGLEADQDTVSAGSGKGLVTKWNEAFGEQYKGAAEKYQPK